MTEYFIPAGAGESEYVEKRSQFLGHVRHVESEEEAKAFLAEMKRTYYDARHNCSCYLLRGGVERYSDDGEPQGTAGLPMLEVFRREGVTDLVCVVTRYFGGVLLGAGGLFRAYTKTAKDALDAAGVAVVRRWEETEFSCSYAAAEALKRELAAFDGLVTDTLYAADVTVKALVPEEKAASFAARILDLSAGTVTVRTVGESFGRSGSDKREKFTKLSQKNKGKRKNASYKMIGRDFFRSFLLCFLGRRRRNALSERRTRGA